MNLEKYDKFVWRANGTLLLLACAVAFLFSLIIGYNILKEGQSSHRGHDIVNVDQETKKEEFLRLGYFHILKGTELILIPLTSEQKSKSSYYSRSGNSHSRNYLILNTKTKESYWIWKSNNFLVLEDVKIHNQIADNRNQKAIGLALEVVENDSNSDAVMNESDQKSIQYFDLTAKKLVSVVSNLDRSIGIQQTGDNEVMFFYSRTGKSFFRTLMLSSMKVSDEKEIGQPL